MMLNAAGIKLVVHHGIIREDAAGNTEVKLDVPLGTDSIRGLSGSKYDLYCCASNIFIYLTLYILSQVFFTCVLIIL